MIKSLFFQTILLMSYIRAREKVIANLIKLLKEEYITYLVLMKRVIIREKKKQYLKMFLKMKLSYLVGLKDLVKLLNMINMVELGL